MLKDINEAIEDYKKAAELAPDFGDAYFYMGGAYSELKEYRKAIKYYDKAVQLDPDNSRGYIARAEAHFLNRNPPKACVDWKRARELGYPDLDKLIEAACKD